MLEVLLKYFARTFGIRLVKILRQPTFARLIYWLSGALHLRSRPPKAALGNYARLDCQITLRWPNLRRNFARKQNPTRTAQLRGAAGLAVPKSISPARPVRFFGDDSQRKSESVIGQFRGVGMPVDAEDSAIMFWIFLHKIICDASQLSRR